MSERRRRYADEVAAQGGIRSPALRRAFSTVPREAYLPPGPWTVEAIDGSYYRTEDAAVDHILHAVGVCLDQGRALNSGSPARIGQLLEAVDIQPGETVFHVGAGLGYFTAIIAELAGPAGRVIAAEIDPVLMRQAALNLAALATVTVAGDAHAITLPPVDVIFASAGLTTIPRAWTAALRPRGRLLLPLTGAFDSGHIFLFGKTGNPDWLSARACTFMRFYPCLGGRDVTGMQALDLALADRRIDAVQWLRLDRHMRGPGCWLHRDDICLSVAGPA